MFEPGLCEASADYFSTLAGWLEAIVVVFIVRLITKGSYDMFPIFTTKRSGNNVKNLMIGLLIGGVMNFICIMIAVAGGSFQLERKEVAITTLVVMFIAVLIQSAYEELFYRGFLLRFIEEASGKRNVAILFTAVWFAFSHLAIPGYGPLLYFFNFFAWGILYALLIYYTDSIWIAFGMHGMWNYTQAVLCGLSNSGGILKPGNFLFGPVATPINNLFYNSPFACGTWARESIASGWVFGVEDSIQSPIVQGIVAVVVFILLKKKMEAARKAA